MIKIQSCGQNLAPRSLSCVHFSSSPYTSLSSEVNCVLGEWTPPGCSGKGVSFEIREVLVAPKNDGTACGPTERMDLPCENLPSCPIDCELSDCFATGLCSEQGDGGTPAQMIMPELGEVSHINRSQRFKRGVVFAIPGPQRKCSRIRTSRTKFAKTLKISQKNKS